MTNIIYILPIVLILTIFVISLYKLRKANLNRLKEYESDSTNLILDDYLTPVKYEKVPGILMSIGIIGTFVLIFFGLSSIPNGLNIAKVLDVIKEQIAPAFLVSAFGIVMSIVYVAFEYIWINKNYTKKLESYKIQNDTKTYTNLATQELQTSQNILNAVNIQTETFKSLSNFSKGLDDVTKSMQQFGEIAKTLDKTLNPKVLGEVISNALLKEMSPVLDNIQTITSNVDKNSQKITLFLEKDLKNEIIEPLKNAVISTDHSMQEMREVLHNTSNIMNKTSKGIEKISENLSKLETSQTEFVTNLDNVLDKQKNEFENTTKVIEKTYSKLNKTVTEQTDKFEENSENILKLFNGLSKDMKTFLVEYKEDYKQVLQEQQKAIIETKDSAVEILNKSGENVASVIDLASDKLNSTLSNVDDALVKTSKNIKKELESIQDTYSKSLKSFLDSQEKILDKVFKEQTKRLSTVVDDFRNNLEKDVNNRKILNEDLDKLIESTNGFVASTQTVLSSAADEQQTQLSSFININKSMQNQLSELINNTAEINKNGNLLTKELLNTIKETQEEFNKHQADILKEYQISVDEHLRDILDYMATIIEASHMDTGK